MRVSSQRAEPTHAVLQRLSQSQHAFLQLQLVQTRQLLLLLLAIHLDLGLTDEFTLLALALQGLLLQLALRSDSLKYTT